jgi:hypothetical protein
VQKNIKNKKSRTLLSCPETEKWRAEFLSKKIFEYERGGGFGENVKMY